VLDDIDDLDESSLAFAVLAAHGWDVPVLLIVLNRRPRISRQPPEHSARSKDCGSRSMSDGCWISLVVMWSLGEEPAREVCLRCAGCRTIFQPSRYGLRPFEHDGDSSTRSGDNGLRRCGVGWVAHCHSANTNDGWTIGYVGNYAG
jgi:hypothetical protein